MQRGVPSDAFRHLVGAYPSGVTVVTTRAADSAPWGFTASSCISVSLVPPLVLVSLDTKADCFPAFSTTEAFVVNILSASQKEIAKRFATRGIDKFAGVAHSPGEHTGAPILDGAAAHLECAVHERVAAGDHVLLIGRVTAGHRAEAAPLVYHPRAFGRVQSE